VPRIAGLYLVGAWLAVQVASTLLPAFAMPGWLLRATITVIAIGFVPALVLAWVFELTPEGLKRAADVDPAESITPHTGARLDRTIMVVLALALGYFAFDKFVLSPRREAAQQQRTLEEVDAARQQGRAEARIEGYGDKSIAVLPFVNMSTDPQQEYFSDGISEELLNLLTKIPQLRVISRSSAFSFKGQSLPIPEIGRRLNAAHILEGSVRKSGNRARITAQLIDARTDTHLWSETYDRRLDDIFAVQDEIAAAVVARLKVELLGKPPKAKAIDPEAYALYLQARQLARQRTAAGFEQAIELFERTLAVEPEYAPAWIGLARVYFNQVGDALRPPEEGYRMAREAAGKALAADRDNAAAHAVFAAIAMANVDFAAAARHLNDALAREPGHVDILYTAAVLAGYMGRLDDAIEALEYLTERDPLAPHGHSQLGLFYLAAGRLDEALARQRTALGLSPGNTGPEILSVVTLLVMGDAPAALAAIQKLSSNYWRLIGLPMALHSLGKKAESDAALQELVRAYGEDVAYDVAYIHAWRGETDLAFDSLDKALAVIGPGFSEILVDPLFASVHADPRWLAFLRKIGMAPEQLERIVFDIKLPG